MLEYDDVGTGPAIVLIHGFPLCRRMWAPQLEVLAAAGYRVVCPDLPGFGDSPIEKPIESMDAYADAIIALLDELELARVVLGGMSMGGYVLFNLLTRYPARCRAALFLVTRAAADDAAGKQKRTELAAAVKAGNRLVVPDTFARILFAPETVEDNPGLIDKVRQWMATASPAGLVGGLLAMRNRADYLDRLGDFALPALVVGAEQDQAVPVEHARALADGLPQATLKIIPGAGHMANLEQPEAFNRALLEFLGKL